MILLDTHIWIWLVSGSEQLSNAKRTFLASQKDYAVSAISCWEIAKLVEKDRLKLTIPIEEWVNQAIAYPGLFLVPLDPKIAVASTQLPTPFHNDPADQIIVATARTLNISLATDDNKIRSYAHVNLAWPS